MKNLTLLVLSLLTSSVLGSVDFYANPILHKKYPDVFATSKKNLPFLTAIESDSAKERISLIDAIKKDALLLDDVLNFGRISLERQIKVLENLFMLECKILKIVPPNLTIDESSIPGAAFFKFDYDEGGAGHVYLNKKLLASNEDKVKFIILLLHETRHSAQFQRSQNSKTSPLWIGFKNSFETQKYFKEKKIQTSFCDFMLLLNEFEAFQFANYVYGYLTSWRSPVTDLGTLAGQYDESGKLRINLIELLNEQGIDHVEEFNKLEQQQYKVLFPEK
jgi:hypothetical protein